MAKQLSGAAKRKLKRQQEQDARRAALGLAPEQMTPEDVIGRYQALGPPPADPVGRVTWANAALAELLWETLTDPGISPADRRRIGGDLGAKVGITTNKAVYEDRLKRIETRLGLAEKEGKDDGREERADGGPPALRG